MRATCSSRATSTSSAPASSTSSCAAARGPLRWSRARSGRPLPDGFESVDVARNGNGLRISFDRKTSNKATIDVFQASAGRNVYSEAKRQIRFEDRESSFNWNGRARGGKRLKNGVFFVRFRIVDDNDLTDSRRVVVQRKNGRFSKKASYYLLDRCG